MGLAHIFWIQFCSGEKTAALESWVDKRMQGPLWLSESLGLRHLTSFPGEEGTLQTSSFQIHTGVTWSSVDFIVF